MKNIFEKKHKNILNNSVSCCVVISEIMVWKSVKLLTTGEESCLTWNMSAVTAVSSRSHDLAVSRAYHEIVWVESEAV